MRIKHLKTNSHSSYISQNMSNKIKTDIYTHHAALFMLSHVKYSFELTIRIPESLC